MHFLSWLAAQFQHTVKLIGRSSASSLQHPFQAAATGASVPLSADFFFFATLLQPLLAHMQTAGQTSSSKLTSHAAGSMEDGTADSVPAAVTTVAAAGAASQAKRKKGQKAGKAREQPLQEESHALPVEWAVPAQGSALLVQKLQSLMPSDFTPLSFAHYRCMPA